MSVQNKSTASVTALAWRPDGKVLAMGYANGMVRVVDIETEEVLFDQQLHETGVTAISWTQTAKSNHKKRSYIERANTLLGPLKPLLKATKEKILDAPSGAWSKAPRGDEQQAQQELDILVVAAAHHVALCPYGAFFLCSLDLASQAGPKAQWWRTRRRDRSRLASRWWTPRPWLCSKPR